MDSIGNRLMPSMAWVTLLKCGRSIERKNRSSMFRRCGSFSNTLNLSLLGAGVSGTTDSA
ncbi:hypothetical protein D9M69_490620 [compost metagenome]